jgi:hypothetical protein
MRTAGKFIARLLTGGHTWQWLVSYYVPLVPLYFLCKWLLGHHTMALWLGWGASAAISMTTAYRIERHWKSVPASGK